MIYENIARHVIKTATIAGLATMLAALPGCKRAENIAPMQEEITSIVDEDISAASFTAVQLDSPDTLIVSIGDTPQLRADGDADAIAALVYHVTGGTLHISRRRDGSGIFANDGRATVQLTVPELTQLTLAGSGDIEATGLDADRMILSLTGSGEFHAGNLSAGTLVVNMTGTGNMRLSGSSSLSDFSVAGSGDLDARYLRSDSADITGRGRGDARIRSGGKADVTILGSGNIRVDGGATCTVKRIGTGRAVCP